MANPTTLAEHENAAAISDPHEPGLVELPRATVVVELPRATLVLEQARTMVNPTTVVEHENAAAISDKYKLGLVDAQYVFCAEMPKAGDVSDLAINKFWQYGCNDIKDAYRNQETAMQTALLQKAGMQMALLQKEMASERASEKYKQEMLAMKEQYKKEMLAMKEQEQDAMTVAACKALPNYGHARMWELCTDNGRTPLDFDFVQTWSFHAKNRKMLNWTFKPKKSNTAPGDP